MLLDVHLDLQQSETFNNIGGEESVAKETVHGRTLEQNSLESVCEFRPSLFERPNEKLATSAG